MRIYMSIAVVAILLSTATFAQQPCTQAVRLTVVETHDFTPVHPAVVFVEELKKAFETDEDGRLTLDSICNGDYVIHVHAYGYNDVEKKITINGSRSMTIKVDYDIHSLSEVVIQEVKHDHILQSKSGLEKTDLDAQQGKTLATMLEKVNGLSTLSNGATIAKPVIHGMHSNRILMLNNGVRQEDQQWGAEHAPNIDPFTAERITVIKGAAGVRYGTDAIGGVILVEPKPLPTTAGWNGELNLAGFSNNRMGVGSLMLERAFKKIPALSFRVQGSYKKGGNYRVPAYWVANTGVEERDYSAALGYRKLHYGAEIFYSRFSTDLGIYKGSHTGNQNDLVNAINSPFPLVPANFTYELGRPRQHVVHNLVKLKAYADSRVGTWNLVYGYQHNFRQEYDIVRKENGRAQLNLTLQTHSLNLDLNHKKVLGLTGQVGIDMMYQDNRFQDGDRIFIPTYQSTVAAAYLIERKKINKWFLEAGLRYDYKWYGVYNPEGTNQQFVYYEFDFANPSATLGLKHHTNSRFQWSATLSNAWRAPQANELFSAGFHHGAARIERGNKDLKSEKAYSINLDSSYELYEKLHAEVSLYSQLINNYIYLEPGEDLLTIRGYFKTFNYQQTNAWLNGVDASLRYDWNAFFSSTLKGSMLRARDRSENDWLILMPSDRVSLSTRFTKSWSEKWKHSFAEVSGRYNFRQNRIPRDFDVIDFPRPPAAYFLLDASIGIERMLGKQPLSISIAATNILNAKYRDYLDVFRYFLNQQGRNIALRMTVPFQFQ